MKIYPAKSLRGTVDLPGDKSISHRAAMIGSMAVGQTQIANFSTAKDCQTTLNCLRELGVQISQNGAEIAVTGVGITGFSKPTRSLDCGNSGTTMRLLVGILVGQSFDSVLTGDGSLSKRPMARILSPLTKMGAETEAENACAPIRIKGVHDLNAIDHELTVASAQVKSCLLFAGLLAKGKTILRERLPTRDHSERMLRWFGADLNVTLERISITGNSVLTARDVNVPCDLSSAAFFLVAAASLEHSDILIPFVGLNPTRTGIIDVLKSFGADVRISKANEFCSEPVGSIRVRGGFGKRANTSRVCLNGAIISKIIDEIPILAVLGTQIDGGIEIRDAGELRHKESDRISAIVQNLRRMDAVVEEYPDGFKAERSYLKGAEIDSFGDHRIAMAFAIAGLLAAGETKITGAECVDISFPGFFEALSNVVE